MNDLVCVKLRVAGQSKRRGREEVMRDAAD